MKFPSIKNLAQNALITIKRFPLEVLFALAGTIAGIIKIELSYLHRVNENWCLRTMMMANLGLLLSLSASLYTEAKAIGGSKKLLIKLVAAAAAILLIFIVNPGERESDYIRFLLLSLSFHLLVAYAAFTNKDHIQGFWQFNKTLFLRFLTGALYSAVLFLGLAAAIGAMNFLFNFKFEWDTFSILWVCIVGIFNTLFFLAGVPADVKALDTDLSYPKGLKVFTQYVLIPLATVYVVILLAYEVKILVQWQLPKGMVSYLILSYAVFGVLSLLLVYPIREQAENKWLKTYARSFYFLLIPLLILLFTAAGTRVFRYGITEMRYFLIVLACWLLFITIYFLIAKKQNIKLIPISLSILTLLSIYGPQSAFQVSMYSQRRVLADVFKKNNALKDGKFISVDSLKISKKDANKAVATLDYLISKHDLPALQPYFNEDLGKVSDSLAAEKGKPITLNENTMTDYQLRGNKLNWVKKRLGLNNFWGDERYDESEPDSVAEAEFETYNFNTPAQDVTTIKGYDYLINEKGMLDDTIGYKIDGIYIAKLNANNGEYILQLDKSTITFNLGPLLDSLVKPGAIKSYTHDKSNMPYYYIVPEKKLTIIKRQNGIEVSFKIKSVMFSKAKGRIPYVVNIDASYLIRKETPKTAVSN